MAAATRRSSTSAGEAAPHPKTIGEHVVLRRIGTGAQSEVFAVRDDAGATIALKWMREGTDPRRVQREVRVALRVRDPRVVAFRGYGVHEGRPFITMDLVEGQALPRALADLPTASSAPPSARDTPGPSRSTAWQTAAIFADVADGLAAMHDAGLVHRDLKPDNVCVDRRGRACIVDLGLAKPLDRLFDPDAIGESITHGTQLIGTVRYMSPEQLRGEEATPRSDLYSLGVMLFEAIAGAPPYDAPTPMAVALAHLSAPIPSLASRAPGTPQPLCDLVAELLAKDARDRPASARDVAKRLRRETIGATPVAARLAPPSFEGRSNEMDWARQALSDAGAGRARTLIVVGGIGNGKTRLLEEIARRARGRGFVTAIAGGKTRHPIDALLGDLASSLRELGGREAVDEAFRGGAAAARERVADLDDGQVEEAAPPSSGASPAHRLGDALRTLVRQTADIAPLLVAIDDAHLLDEDGCRAVMSLVDFAADARVVLAVVFGDAELPRSASGLVRRLVGRSSTTRIEVAALTRAQTGAAIASMLGVRECPEPLLEYVAARAHGNPFIARELVQASFEQGALSRGEEGWRFDPKHAAALPAMVASVVTERLATLTHDQRMLTVELAVLGEGAPHEVLAACTRLADEGAFLDALDGLLRARVFEERADRRGTYAFAHAALATVLLDGIDATTRARLHHRVAARLTSATRGQPSYEVLGMIARHQEAAGHTEAAAEAFFALTKRALRRGDSEGARRALESFDRTASDATRATDEVADVRIGVARLRGDLKEAERLLRAICADPRAQRRAEAYLGLAGVFEDGGRHRDVVDATEAALATLGAPSIPRGVAAIVYTLVTYVYVVFFAHFRERTDAAIDVVTRAYVMAARNSFLIDRIFAMAAGMRAIARARRLGARDQWVAGQPMLAVVSINFGATKRARALIATSRAEVSSIRDASLRCQAGYSALAAMALAGRELDDPKFADEVATFAQVMGDRQAASTAHGYRAWAAFQRGELDAAQREVLRFLGDRSNDLDLPLIGMHHRVLGAVAVARGDRRLVQEEMKRAETIAGGRAAAAPHDEILAAIAVSVAALALDDPGTAVMWARRAAERAQVTRTTTGMAVEVWGHYLAARALDGVRSLDRLDRLAVREARRCLQRFGSGQAINARGLALWAFSTESAYGAAAILNDEERRRAPRWETYDGAINDLCAARFLGESDVETARARSKRGRETLAKMGAVVPAWLARLPADPTTRASERERTR